jgi:hypothetical protein
MREWWMNIVREAKNKNASTQGYYVLAADGTPVAFDNNISRIGSFIEDSLQRARQVSSRTRAVTKSELEDAAPAVPPAGTSVVRLYTRIRPVPAGADEMNEMLGRDSMWILAEEVRAMGAEATKVGRELELPENLVTRLVLFHLIDNVRGQVWPWQPASIKKAVLRGRVSGVEGDRRKLVFTGTFAKQDTHPPQWTDRGQEGTIEGELEIDVKTERVVRFRAIAKSTAWTDLTANVVARAPSGKYSMVTAIIEAEDALAQRVAPERARDLRNYLRPRGR